MENDLLARELGKIGRLAAEIGGTLPGVETVSGSGVSSRVQAVAGFLPTEIFSAQLPLNVPADKALRAGFSILSRIGEIQKKETEETFYPCLIVVAKGGFLNMNPSVIYFQILHADSSSCTVTVTGAAKEGRIKQKTAERVVQRVMTCLREAIDQPAG
jgi:hypothetical protein